MKQILLAIFVVISSIQANYAQSSTKNTSPQIMPKSPDVASLDKYGDIPVSECSGTASFEVPLAHISIGEFTLPIRLSYYKNGLRVEEIPSSVGDGWSLQFGGAVSFQQNGINDLKTGGLLAGWARVKRNDSAQDLSAWTDELNRSGDLPGKYYRRQHRRRV